MAKQQTLATQYPHTPSSVHSQALTTPSRASNNRLVAVGSVSAASR